jgi:hypothetical protein
MDPRLPIKKYSIPTITIEETEYRSGPQPAEFFNALGFSETYQWGGAPQGGDIPMNG